MTLKVIGSGLGRTGTTSLRMALIELGFGPCHHMLEVIAHPETMPLWIEARNGNPRWDNVFAGYQSAVDYPTAAYWRELAAYFPEAKIVHTVRDPDKWFESTQATIFASDGYMARAVESGDCVAADFFTSVAADFNDHLHDRAYMTDYFRRHTQEVKATIAPERLLVYQASEGWRPLCEFLGVPVPDMPYPSENTREDFLGRHGGSQE